MRNRIRTAVAVLLMAGMAAACSRGRDDAPPVATPSLTLSTSKAAIGSPVEMTYRFAVAPDAPPFTEDNWVFVHFIDTNGELMWTDDHRPATPVKDWKPGSTVEYRRTMFIPKFPYVGQTRVEIGLFSPSSGTRVPLAGQSGGQRSYEVAQFDMQLQTGNVFVVFRDGWYEAELATEGSGREWQWSKKDATLSFPNPRRNVRFYLQADQPGTAAFPEPQRVELRIAGAVVDSFTVGADASDIRRIEIPASQLGDADTVEMTISVDKTFIPADVPSLKSTDPRELGIRVFRAFVQPL